MVTITFIRVFVMFAGLLSISIGLSQYYDMIAYHQIDFKYKQTR